VYLDYHVHSSFRYALSDLTPSKDIIKLYKELGGKIITIGSDSHKEEYHGYKGCIILMGSVK